MNHHLEELATSYVLDRLDADARAEFETRLAQDAELLAHVRRLEASLAQHIRALPQHQPPAELLERIEQRIEGTPAPRAVAPRRNAVAMASVIARWGIAAVIALSLGVIAVKQLLPSAANPSQPYVIVVGLDSTQSTRTEMPLPRPAPTSDAAFIQLASMAERFWEQPAMLPGTPSSDTAAGRAYALFDPKTSQGFIGVEQLPPLPEGSRYHLWIVDATTGEIRDAGILPLNNSTRGLYFFSTTTATESKPARVDFFVTVEDVQTSAGAAPRGKVVLGQTRI